MSRPNGGRSVRHFPYMDRLILKWGVSFHSQSATLGARTTFAFIIISCRYGAGYNSKRVTRGSQFTTMKQEKENVGSKGSESGRPPRHIGPYKDLSYSRRSGGSMGIFRTPQIAAQRGHFQLLKPRGKYKCLYSACHFPSLSISRSLSCSRVVN